MNGSEQASCSGQGSSTLPDLLPSSGSQTSEQDTVKLSVRIRANRQAKTMESLDY